MSIVDASDTSTLIRPRPALQRPALIPKVGITAVSSPLEVGAGRARSAISELKRAMEMRGCQVVTTNPIDGPDQAVAAGRQFQDSRVNAILLAAVSWFEDYLVIDLLEECPVPVLLWSLPGMETGALCGTQQLTAFLKYLNMPYRCVYGRIEDSLCMNRANTYLRAATLRSLLRRSRIGMAGSRVNGMTHSAPNEFALKRSIGSRVVPLDLDEIVSSAKRTPEEEARTLWQEMSGGAGTCLVDSASGLYSMHVYLALAEVIERCRLNAVAVGCYHKLMGRVCLAASLLADRGVPLACEGDVNGAAGQLILSMLTGRPTHNTDWLEPLPDGTTIFTHCGSGSFQLAENVDDIVLAPVRLMEQGVCALFPAESGPVTLLSLTPGDSGYQCALLEGEAVKSEMVFPGNPVRVHFREPVSDLMDWIHDEGISHHWMIGYGHVGAEVREFAAMAGNSLRVVEPR